MPLLLFTVVAPSYFPACYGPSLLCSSYCVVTTLVSRPSPTFSLFYMIMQWVLLCDANPYMTADEWACGFFYVVIVAMYEMPNLMARCRDMVISLPCCQQEQSLPIPAMPDIKPVPSTSNLMRKPCKKGKRRSGKVYFTDVPVGYYDKVVAGGATSEC